MAVISTDKATLSLTANINGATTERIFSDFVSGDTYEISPQNDRTSHINATNGGVSLQKRSDGGVHNLTVRVQKGSDDDIFLNSALYADGLAVFDGASKEILIKDGTEVIETWTLETGTIVTSPTSIKNDQDGNALSEYTIRFRNAIRTL